MYSSAIVVIIDAAKISEYPAFRSKSTTFAAVLVADHRLRGDKRERIGDSRCSIG
jgi:hypothetical protein